MGSGKRSGPARINPTDSSSEPVVRQRPPTRQSVQDTIDAFQARLTHIQRQERFLLKPDSPKIQNWDIVLVVALLFTSIVTPYEVALITTEINFAFLLNRVVDLIFLVDLVRTES